MAMVCFRAPIGRRRPYVRGRYFGGGARQREKRWNIGDISYEANSYRLESNRGQSTLPVSLRKRIGIKNGGAIILEEWDNELVLKPAMVLDNSLPPIICPLFYRVLEAA